MFVLLIACSPLKNDQIGGGNGNDTVIGLGGDDELYGQIGDDQLDGGSGIDTNQCGAGTNDSKYDMNDTVFCTNTSLGTLACP